MSATPLPSQRSPAPLTTRSYSQPPTYRSHQPTARSQSPVNTSRTQSLTARSQLNTGRSAASNTIKYGVYACNGCTNPFVALSYDEQVAAEFQKAEGLVSNETGVTIMPEPDGLNGYGIPVVQQNGDTDELSTPLLSEKKAFTRGLTATTHTMTWDGHPLFHYHVDMIQWLDTRLNLRKYAKEVVIDFTGAIFFPMPMLMWLLVFVLPMLFAGPIVLAVICVKAICRYGMAQEMIPVITATLSSGLAYVALYMIGLQRIFERKAHLEVSYIELLSTPSIGLLICLALLCEIFLLRVEDSVASQAREQLLASPQAMYSHGDHEYSDLHGLFSLLRHMSKSLRQKSDLESVFHFSVIEQILCSDTRHLHHSSVNEILDSMRSFPKGPSPSNRMAKRGVEPLTLAWKCYVKYKRSEFRSHMRSFFVMFAISLLVALAPGIMRMHHHGQFIPERADIWEKIIVFTHVVNSFGGMFCLLILLADGMHRFAHLKRCLVVILYISGTPRFRPALHARFTRPLSEIVVAPDGGSECVDVTRIEDSANPESRLVQAFADRFIKMRELANVGEDKVSVNFPTLAVNKFFLLRYTLRTLVAVERIRQQMYLFAIMFSMLVAAAFIILPLFIGNRGANDHVVVGFILFCIVSYFLINNVNEAVIMNSVMQSQSIATLKAWFMEIQEVHWTLQAHYQIAPVSEARLLLDNYFAGLLAPYHFMVSHINESEKPIMFFGMPITTQKKNQILGSVASSGVLFLIKMLSTVPVGAATS